MSRKPTSKRIRPKPRAVLRLPDLDQAKSAVLNSLTSADAQRGYRHAINEFVDWYCSEPRLSFNRSVVLRYRIHLEGRRLAPGTVNLRLGAVRRLAYEAADCGLLSPDLAAGIRRVKGVKKIGVRIGNWLTAPPPVRSVPGATVSEGFASIALLTPPVATLSVPLPVIGPPVKPVPLVTLVTVLVPGKICPVANVICPLLAMCSPVSEGLLVPEPNNRFSVPEGEDVSLPDGSACH